MNIALEAGVAIYVAMAVALSVWIGIFAYLWRIDAHAQELKRKLEQQRPEVPQTAPRATLTRVERQAEEEPVNR